MTSKVVKIRTLTPARPAVALDAFILRTVLVPAMMHIFGDANWLPPRWLDRRLPRLAIEPDGPERLAAGRAA